MFPFFHAIVVMLRCSDAQKCSKSWGLLDKACLVKTLSKLTKKKKKKGLGYQFYKKPVQLNWLRPLWNYLLAGRFSLTNLEFLFLFSWSLETDGIGRHVFFLENQLILTHKVPLGCLIILWSLGLSSSIFLHKQSIIYLKTIVTPSWRSHIRHIMDMLSVQNKFFVLHFVFLCQEQVSV